MGCRVRFAADPIVIGFVCRRTLRNRSRSRQIEAGTVHAGSIELFSMLRFRPNILQMRTLPSNGEGLRVKSGGCWLDYAITPTATMSFAEDAVEIVVARLNVEHEAVDTLTALLSDTERQRASRFAFDRDRNRFVSARAGLRELLATRLGVRPESVELTYGVRGKPSLSQRFADSDLRFNVSHSDDVAVYALSRGREIGIDVEAIRMIPDADDIAVRFFSRRENEAYFALDPRDRSLGFFNCWTRKEAFIKALGDGLYYPLDRFDVSLAPGEPARILRVESTPGKHCGWCVESFSPSPGFVAAVVTESRKRHVAFPASFPRSACSENAS